MVGKRSPGLLETIFDQVDVAVAAVDAQHRVVYANEHALQIFGVARGANVSHLEDLANRCHYFDWAGNEIPVEKLPIARALAGEDVQPHNLKVALPDGSIKWLHVTNHHFSVLGLSGALMVATDETREVELQRVASTVQKSEVLSTLAGAIAHNFNNILSIISLGVFTALDRQNVGAETRAILQQISDACRHAADVTKRLAQFSRTQQLLARPTSINHLIRDALVVAEPLLSGNITVVTQLDPNLPEIEIDRVEMEQVFFNLILNARDAMPQGGQLTVTTEKQVRSSDTTMGREGKQWVTITVSDTGAGIPETIVDRVFEPFFTTKANGTGLGLASAQGIVRQHGGEIKVQSAVGKGTEFTVYLPPSREDSAALL
jgi:PAS domain S-box-containing protein